MESARLRKMKLENYEGADSDGKYRKQGSTRRALGKRQLHNR
jgi:hypothetical protein